MVCGHQPRLHPKSSRSSNAETNKGARRRHERPLLGNGLLIESGSPEDFAKFQKDDTGDA